MMMHVPLLALNLLATINAVGSAGIVSIVESSVCLFDLFSVCLGLGCCRCSLPRFLFPCLVRVGGVGDVDVKGRDGSLTPTHFFDGVSAYSTCWKEGRLDSISGLLPEASELLLPMVERITSTALERALFELPVVMVVLGLVKEGLLPVARLHLFVREWRRGRFVGGDEFVLNSCRLCFAETHEFEGRWIAWLDLWRAKRCRGTGCPLP